MLTSSTQVPQEAANYAMIRGISTERTLVIYALPARLRIPQARPRHVMRCWPGAILPYLSPPTSIRPLMHPFLKQRRRERLWGAILAPRQENPEVGSSTDHDSSRVVGQEVEPPMRGRQAGRIRRLSRDDDGLGLWMTVRRMGIDVCSRCII